MVCNQFGRNNLLFIYFICVYHGNVLLITRYHVLYPVSTMYQGQVMYCMEYLLDIKVMLIVKLCSSCEGLLWQLGTKV